MPPSSPGADRPGTGNPPGPARQFYPGEQWNHGVRVLLVEDHVLVREGTVQLLSQEPGIEVVAHVGTADAALELLARSPIDVAVVDVSLPVRSGLALARDIAERHPGVRVLMLSAYDEHAYVAEALDAGAGGYLLKTASTRELVDAIRAVADGILVLDRAVSDRVTRRGRSRQSPPRQAPLTPRETDVLLLLARGRSNKQMAAHLGLGIRTVEGYVSNVLAKLGVASRTEAVLYALSHHLVPAADGDRTRDG